MLTTSASVRTSPPLAREPGGQRLGQPPRATLGDREAGGLPHHAEQQPHHGGAGSVERDVGVRGVAAQQHPGPRAAEPLPAELGDRRQQGLHVAEAADLAQRRQRPQTVPDRRERRQQGADDVLPHVVPLLAQPQPRLAVAGVQAVQPGGRLVTVPVEHRPGAVREGMSQHRRRVPPGQPVLLQPERLDRRGDRGQGVEGAEGVVHEGGIELAVAADRSADVRLRLEDEDRPARVDEDVRGHQSVGSGADDHRVPAHDPVPLRRPRATRLRPTPTSALPNVPRSALPCGRDSSTLPGPRTTGRVRSWATTLNSGLTRAS